MSIIGKHTLQAEDDVENELARSDHLPLGGQLLRVQGVIHSEEDAVR